MVGFLWSLFRVSSPDHIFLPIPNWEHKENPETEEDVGPVVQHIYEVCSCWLYLIPGGELLKRTDRLLVKKKTSLFSVYVNSA